MIKRLIFALVITILLLMPLVACQPFSAPSPSPSPTATPSPAPSPAPTVTFTPPASQNQAPPLPSIADVVALAKPSVVAITTEVVTRDIFNRPVTQQGAGSGWIMDSNGIIVTNNHVVEGANTITVTLSDGRVFTAQEVKTDAFTDLAILRVNATGLPAAKIGSAARLRVGDWVVAIGNPLGLGISAKEGIISRIGISLPVSEGQTLHDLLETSAAINPGNSGGPLVNMSGEVIGITSAKIATAGVEGLGYAINIDNATPIISELVLVGCIIRPWLGVESFTIDGGLSVIFGLPVDKGAIVTTVVADSPAARGGIRQNDIIVSFQGKAINSSQELIQAEHSSQIGQKVTIALLRGNNRINVEVTLTESPPCT